MNDNEFIQGITQQEFKEGFVTEVEQEYVPKGLNEDIIRLISRKKEEPQWLLDFRLDAFRKWQKMKQPTWGHLKLPPIDYQDIIYYAAPKKDSERPKEIDPALADTFEKLGIPLHVRETLAGVVAVDAVFDSVSVTTTFRKTLQEKGIIFCSFSEAVKEHRTWYVSTWPAWFRCRTISLRRLIPQCSATDLSATFPRGCIVLWTCPVTSA